MNRNLLAVALLLFVGLQGLDTSTTSCDNSCETDSSCDPGFYCCNSKCVPLPGIGESCPCSRCNANSSLLCKGGMCVFNGPNCTCNDASDCSTDGRAATCINNLCGIQSGGMPPTPISIGQSCSHNMSCYDSRYCNSSNVCDYAPPNAYCTSTKVCTSGYVCAGSKCLLPKAVSEPCEANEQCPTSYTCRADSASSQPICTTKGGLGDYCTEIFDCVNSNCTNNACYLPSIGEPCFNGMFCADGFVCRFGKCASNVTLPDGSACERTSDCTSKICANGLCWPMSFTSGSCNVSQQCPDGRCVNGKCFSIAFYTETCNATQVCFDQSRPCVNGTCPRLYSAYGEYCAVNEHCLFGSCLSNSCGFPTSSCNVSADCGLNSICDCGQCKPNRLALYNSFYYQNMYYGLSTQMNTRRPTSTCFSDAFAPNCDTTRAKFNCYLLCAGFQTWAFPNGIKAVGFNIPPGFHLDCAKLTMVDASTSNPIPPCCNAYNQTSCDNTPVVGCTEFHQMNFEPLLQVPEPPSSTPQSTSTPSATPIISTPQTAPSAVPTSVPSAVPVSTPSAVPTATPSAVPSTVPSSAPAAPITPVAPVGSPSVAPIPLTCQCATPTPMCDATLNVCVGLRVTPIIQCVQRANNQYVALMSYDNHQSSVVTLNDAINILNVAVQAKPSNFAVGRPFMFPQSAFNVTSSTGRQVSWYLDGFELNFDLADETLACPQDVTFVMTSSATVDQLQAISNDIIGNLSSIMSIPESRLNVTFSSASTKRQTSNSLITVVVLSSSSTSEPTPFAAALQFIETGSSEFIARVPAASVEQVTAVPLPNEQTGSETVTPPTSDESPKQSPPPSQSPRAVVSLAQNTIVHVGLIVLAFIVLFS